MNEEIKLDIRAALIKSHKASGLSQSKFAIKIGSNNPTISTIFNQNWDSVTISDAKWRKIAFAIGYELGGEIWKDCDTSIKQFIHTTLAGLQFTGMTKILIEQSGIGKSFNSMSYCKSKKNAFYVDCSTCTTKKAFIIQLGRVCGLDVRKGNYDDFKRTVTYIKGLNKPLLVLDDAGDLVSSAFLVIKLIYNELKHVCGLGILGSDGLKDKIERGLRTNKNGYSETFNRLGKRYSSIFEDELKRQETILADMRRVALGQNIDTETFEGFLSEKNSNCTDLRQLEFRIVKFQKLGV